MVIVAALLATISLVFPWVWDQEQKRKAEAGE